jgi:lipoyl(octanoyl) transferase
MTARPAPSRLDVRHLGIVPYGEALELQRALAEDRIAGRIPDTLLLLEHPPVITLGRGWKQSSLPLDPDALRRRGIEVFEIERGGDVTYHGPGQLVGYPIIDLQQHRPDLHWYLRQLEAVLITALANFGIPAERSLGLTGVWTNGRKIASIGVHVKRWVTWHGFALNVTTELSPFSLIVPCGIPDVVMTSVANETAGQQDGKTASDLATEVSKAVVTAFEHTFGLSQVR